MTNYRYIAPCHFGIEKTLSFEVKKIGGEDIAVSDGKVAFISEHGSLAEFGAEEHSRLPEDREEGDGGEPLQVLRIADHA